jgi:hypothetical protein
MALSRLSLRQQFDPRWFAPALWLDGADSSAITISSGTSVSQWNDKSGNNRHVSQSTAANQPNTSTFNGLGCLSFDGVNDQLNNTASNLTGTGTYTGGFHVFYVAARDSAALNGGTVLTERGNALVGLSQWYQDGSGRYISSDGANASSNHTIGTGTYALLGSAGAVVSHTHVPGSRDRLWINGSEQTVTAGTASNISGSTTGFRIGAREGSVGQRWYGLICEVIVLARTITDGERQAIERYMQSRWRIA